MTDNISSKGQATLAALEAALDRLLAGKPEFTPADGKINMARVNEEAQQSRGAIYHYKDFVAKARDIITAHKANKKKAVSVDDDPTRLKLIAMKEEISKLKAANQRLKRDKAEAVEMRESMHAHANEVMAQYASLEQSLLTKLYEIERLKEEKANLSKVINLQVVK